MKDLVVVMIMIGMLLYSTFVMIDYHERAHMQIYRNYGCLNTSYKIHLDPLIIPTGANTYCHNHSNIDNYDDMIFLHSMNEVVGYHIIGQTHVIVFMLLILFLAIVLRDDKGKYV